MLNSHYTQTTLNPKNNVDRIVVILEESKVLDYLVDLFATKYKDTSISTFGFQQNNNVLDIYLNGAQGHIYKNINLSIVNVNDNAFSTSLATEIADKLFVNLDIDDFIAAYKEALSLYTNKVSAPHFSNLHGLKDIYTVNSNIINHHVFLNDKPNLVNKLTGISHITDIAAIIAKLTTIVSEHNSRIHLSDFSNMFEEIAKDIVSCYNVGFATVIGTPFANIVIMHTSLNVNNLVDNEIDYDVVAADRVLSQIHDWDDGLLDNCNFVCHTSEADIFGCSQLDHLLAHYQYNKSTMLQNPNRALENTINTVEENPIVLDTINRDLLGKTNFTVEGLSSLLPGGYKLQVVKEEIDTIAKYREMRIMEVTEEHAYIHAANENLEFIEPPKTTLGDLIRDAQSQQPNSVDDHKIDPDSMEAFDQDPHA